MSQNDEKKAEVEILIEPAGPSIAFEVTEDNEVALDENNGCNIPMVLFSSSNQKEDVPTETTEDECDDDCESFNPADLLKFAWQIARGMVSQIDFFKTLTLTDILFLQVKF